MQWLGFVIVGFVQIGGGSNDIPVDGKFPVSPGPYIEYSYSYNTKVEDKENIYKVTWIYYICELFLIRYKGIFRTVWIIQFYWCYQIFSII